MSSTLKSLAKTIPLYRERSIPIVLVTGFLGAGKTTFIKHYLSHGKSNDTAVIVNEFGEIGLDHLILETVGDDILLMENGCLCCSSSGDLERTLMSLYERRLKTELPSYSRVIIEMSGIAEPQPILAELNSDTLKLSPYRYQGMINILDAQTFRASYEESFEARMQVLYADKVLINKGEGLPAKTIEEIQAVLLQKKGEPAELLQMVYSGCDKVVMYINGIQTSRLKNQPTFIQELASHPDGIFSIARSSSQPIPFKKLVGFVDDLVSDMPEEILRIKLLAPNPEGEGQLFLQTVRNCWFPRQVLNTDEAGSTNRISLVVIARQGVKSRISSSVASFFDYAHGDA